MRFILLFLLLTSGVQVLAQSEINQHQIDSLKNITQGEQHDTIKVKAYRKLADLTSEYDSELNYNVNRNGLKLCDLNLKTKNTESVAELWLSKKAFFLNDLGANHYAKRNLDSALYYFDKSLKIKKQIKDVQGQFAVRGNIASVYMDKSDYDTAANMYQETIAKSKEIDDLETYSKALSNLARLYTKTGNYKKTIELSSRAYGVHKKLDDTRGMAVAINIQGMGYTYLGNYDSALVCYKESAKIYDQLGNNRGQSFALGNIAGIYNYQGKLVDALNYYEKALKFKMASNDKYGEGYIRNNIGVLYGRIGDTAKAKHEYDLSLKLRKEVGDRKGEASTINNIGTLYQKFDEYDSAVYYFEKGLELRRTIGDVRGVYTSHNNLGIVYQYLGKNDLAKLHLDSALNLAIQYNSTSSEISTRNNLGNYFFREGEYEKAIIQSDSALSMAEKIGEHKSVIDVSRSLFRTNYTLKDYDKAQVFVNKILQAHEKDIRINHPLLSESNREAFFMTMEDDFSLLYELAAIDELESPEILDQAFNWVIRRKGFLLRSSTALRNSILASGDSTLIQEYQNWIDLKRQISKSYASGKSIGDLAKKASNKEKTLVNKSTEFREAINSNELNWVQIQNKLSDGETVIEFVRFTHWDDYRNDSDEVELYAALVLKKGSEHPEMIKLFREPELEKILGSFPGNNLSYIEQVYGSKENTKSQLYDLIWKPMEEALEGTKKVYISPAGLLHKISFAALAKEQDVYLCDVYDIETKSSTGKIVLNAEDDVAETLHTKSQTTLFGGIQYNSESTHSNIGWNYLDGTLEETQAIEKILKKQKRPYQHFTLANATEAQFKQTASQSSVLHIATHGFFYPDPETVQVESIDESENDLTFRGGRTGMGSNTFVKSRNPLMRSGLAFAGANDVWNKTKIEGEDGVLTAAEVATIDMRNTDLVVLSACETGLGDIKGSEGVYGLQRSFKMAGVKYLIMSLWQVPDKETAEFMTTFYKHLTQNNDIKKSFNLTQKQMRKKYDPYYWAAFVLVE